MQYIVLHFSLTPAPDGMILHYQQGSHADTEDEKWNIQESKTEKERGATWRGITDEFKSRSDSPFNG